MRPTSYSLPAVSSPAEGSTGWSFASVTAAAALTFLMGGGRIFLTDPNPSALQSEGSVIGPIIVSAVFSTAFFMLARHGSSGLFLLARAKFVALFVLWAAASALWAPDPVTTLRRAYTLAGTLLFALALVTHFGAERSGRILMASLAMCVVLSAVVALGLPTLGRHQGDDALQAAHDGLWRGIFTHKNTLGQVSAAAFALAIFCWTFNKRKRGLVAGSAGLCLVMSGSSGGFVSAIVLSFGAMLLPVIARLSPLARWVTLVCLIGLAGPAILGIEWLLQTVLELLGKDATLTGRTTLWNFVFEEGAKHWLVGWGYNSGYEGIRPFVLAMLGFDYVDPHNGYLDVFFGTGVIGLSFAVAYLASFGGRGFRLMLEPGNPLGRFATGPLLILCLVLEGSVLESLLLSDSFMTPLALLAFAIVLKAEADLSDSRVLATADAKIAARTEPRNRIGTDKL